VNAAQCAGFLQHLEHPLGEAIGRPFELEPWQYSFLAEAFELDEGGRPRWSTVVLVLPRGNGKTTLLAGVALYRLIFDEDIRRSCWWRPRTARPVACSAPARGWCAAASTCASAWRFRAIRV
jgi:hypothetical protein